MAKRLNVSLGFTADTAAAKAALQDLQKSLTSLSNSTMLNTKKLGLTQELNEAANAATQLKIKLQEATTPTGSLDLGKFNQSLKASGQDLKYYAAQLKMLGPEGQQAFSQLAQSITLAEVPLRKSSKLLSEFSTTMKNTVRWQLSSSMLHGFMGAVQSATGYAKDLNKSLNNIRIVTGQNTDQMADFAVKANAAAKALSATTTEYTNAALIYYQQGLNDEDVQKRTDLTIKMANVSGQSAEVVSDQLTAIWNNFAEGSDDLEHFADVLTKLGAETASSSDEIAQGMEKFAAIGEMIGLSYDNAAAALATVTAETRQSADVVGTAFKTIFARIQGLSLGDTLEDGTDLNKYSAALESVGISIKGQNGELKDMDIILEEMGAKWQLLSKDQQVALAQTVAGVRQYNQLVALMDNYDIYQENVDRAKNSEGTLQEQADIYAESWEGARDRVTAAAEKIYQTLLDDDAFIGILNVVEDLIFGFGGFIDAIGGLKGVLPIVATLMMKSFGPDIAASIDRIGYNIKLNTKAGRDEILALREDAINATRDIYDDGTPVGAAMVDVGEYQADLQKKLLSTALDLEEKNKTLTEEEKKRAQVLLDENNLLKDQYLQIVKNAEASTEKANTSTNQASFNYKLATFSIDDGKYQGQKGFRQAVEEAGKLQKAYSQTETFLSRYKKAISNLDPALDKNSDKFKTLQQRLAKVAEAADKSGDVIDSGLKASIDKLNAAAASGNIEEMQNILKTLEETAFNTGGNAHDMFEKIRQGAQNAGVDMQKFSPILDQIQAEFAQSGQLTEQQVELFANLGIQVDNAGKIIGGFKGKMATVGDAIGTSVTAAVSLGTALTQVQNAIKNFYTNEDASGLEKFVSILMLATTATQAFQSVQKAGKTIDEAIAGVKARKAAATAVAAGMQQAENVVTAEGTGLINANKIAWLTHPVLGLIAVALMAVVGVITAMNEKIKKNSEALQAEADAFREEAEAAREAEKANRDNLQTMNELLVVYEETGDRKEDLDEVARKLAEAYDIEGAALASLTGEYADYKKVSDAAYEAHKEELEKQLELEEKALKASENALKDTATHVSLDWGGNAVYEYNGESKASLSFDGWGDESNIVNALASMGIGSANSGYNNASFFSYSLEDPASIVAAYDKIYEAQQKLRDFEGISETDLKNSGIYEDMGIWLKAMKDDVEEYRALLEQVDKVKDELGQFGATEEAKEANAALVDELQNVSSLEEYQAWISKITKAFKDAGIEGEELEKRLKTLTDNSFNPLIKTFKTQDNALTELSSKVGKSKQDLTDFFNALDEDAKTYFWQINLRADEESWQQQIEILKYKAEQEKIQVQIEAVASAQSSLKENMSKEDYEKIRESGIDWGNAEEGIIEFSEFVKMSYEEQANFLDSLSSKYRDSSLQNIAVTKQEMEERKAIVEKQLDETLEYIKNQDLPEPKRIKYEADAEAFSKELEQLEKDIDNISADIEIDLIIDEQEDIKGLQKTFDKIKDSITPLTNIFDSIASGIKQTMDDSGNAVWGFSKEAVQAVESIYPGFMQNLTLLKDGTFAVSNEMYQAIFDAENGALLANTEATAGKLQNLATEAYAKADYYEQAAQAAYELAKGEVDANGVVKEDKQKTLLDAVKNTQEADSDIVTMTEETLGQQLEADNQYRDALQGTAEYQSTSTEEAAKNMAYNTASGAAAAMTNLGKVRDAAYAAAKQVAQIGSDTPQFETFDEALQWDATGRVDIKAADTSSIDSLVKTIGSQLDLNIGDGENDEAEKSAAYQALGDSLSQTAAQWREAGNAAMATLSELLGSVSDASDAIDELDKNTSKALEDLAERYHEMTREIQAQEHALNKLEKLKARSFGGDKLNYINQEIAAYKALETEQLNIYALRLADLELDKIALQKKFNNGVNFNDKNEITNFTALYNAGDEEQRKALEQYEKTLDALRDQEMTLEDITDKLQELHYEKLTYKLELELEINDEALKEVEYKLKQMENDFFKMAEMVTLTYGNRTLIEDSYGDLTTFESALKADYDAGKISQAQYIEGLQTVRDNVYGLVDSLMELDDTMTHYYGDTLTAGAERLAMYTAEMDQLVSVLDHYMNLADILGKSKDYEMMGNFLQGKADIIADELAIATKDYDYLAAKKAEIQNIFFNMKPDDENYGYWEEQWRAISEATNKAQETLLSKTEEWAESMKAVIENNLAAAADNLENLLTGDTSFNEMMTELERLNERQEEFLTTTNKMYETNKLMRTAQTALDKTDNTYAKAKLKDYIKETEALQNKTSLSKYELELQQSKYDLLLAEIALSEAQNAKSTVRLTRDDEGNFGYVYTSDQEAIDKAEQELEDAENALYNKSLEGINGYAEKYAQAKRDMYDELTELQNQYLNGEIASEEEYNRLREQILDHYLGPNGILTQYQDLYRIAVSANSAAAEEAWNDDYIDMTEDVEDLRDAVDEYLKDVDEDFETWQSVSTTANTTVKGALDDSKTATDNLTSASDDLKTEVEEELLPALQAEYDLVWNEVEAYAAKRTEVKGLITDYLNYISTLNQVIAAEARKEQKEKEKEQKQDQNPPAQEPEDTNAPVLSKGAQVTVKSSATHFSRDGGSGTKMKSYVPGNSFTVKDTSGDEVLIGDPSGPNYTATGITGWVKKTDLVGFLTGGYTGEWGPDGKLAMLHQKELILNAKDTENMLSVVMAVREIMSSIDKQAMWASNGLGMLTAMGHNTIPQNLEQTVTIHAEFPNATNHSEIEEAFTTLINRASQYANRK